MDWKTLVSKQNAKTYVLPPGWQKRDDVAEELGCAPERVNENLRLCIANRTAEKKDFIVWDAQLGQKVRVTAYRMVSGEAQANASSAWTDEQMKTAKKMLKAGATLRQVGDKIGRSRDAVKAWVKRGAA